MKVTWGRPIIDMAKNEYSRPRFWEHKIIHPCWKLGVPNTLSLAVIWLSATGRISWVREMAKYKWVKLKGEDFLNKNLGKVYSHWEINHKKIFLLDLQFERIRNYANVKIGQFKKSKLPKFISLIKDKDRYVIIDGNHTAYYWITGKHKIDYIYVGELKK